MNDIRNLMDNLHTHIEYREFDAGAGAPTDSWPVLERLGRAAQPDAAVVPAESPPPAARRLAAVANARAAATQPRRSLLGRYASAADPQGEPVAADDVRQLSLAEVFALLERAGR